MNLSQLFGLFGGPQFGQFGQQQQPGLGQFGMNQGPAGFSQGFQGVPQGFLGMLLGGLLNGGGQRPTLGPGNSQQSPGQATHPIKSGEPGGGTPGMSGSAPNIAPPMPIIGTPLLPQGGQQNGILGLLSGLFGGGGGGMMQQQRGGARAFSGLFGQGRPLA